MIVGAGGHARVVTNIAALNLGLQIVGIADRTPGMGREIIGGMHVNAHFENLPDWRKQGIEGIALALGDNRERETVMAMAEQNQLACVTLIHPWALIERSASVGDGSIVCAGAILTPECRVGRGVIVNTGAIIDHETEVGDFAQISPGVSIAGRAKIGRRALIGIGASVLPNISIGQDAIVGAGAVVTRDVPDGVTVVGCPARILVR